MQSPAKLISSLKQGDPRAIAITAVFLFFISVLWFSWTYLFPPEEDKIPFRQRPAVQTDVVTGERLSETLKQQQSKFEGDTSLNPFYLQPPRNEPKPKPKPKPTRKPNDPPPVKPKPTLAPKPPAKETITYVFQGMLTRPDGVRVAFIQIPKEGKSVYVKAGDTLTPLEILTVMKDGVEVSSNPKTRPFMLLPGEPQTFTLEP